MNCTRLLLITLGSMILVAEAQAQYELKAGNFNSIFVPQTAAGAVATPSGPAVVADPLPTTNQFSVVGQVAGAVGPVGTGVTAFADCYPSNPTKTLILVRATIGGVFASGVPRFSLGDVITQPLAQIDGVTPAAAGYWRVKPVQPGKIFQINGSSQTFFPLVNVNVSSAATNLTTVTVVAPIPAELIVDAILLGQPVTRISGTNVTLAGNATASISSATPVPITPATSYYYSPHAERAFASQAGRVTITWVTRVANGNGNYFTKTEEFAVSTTTLPVRTIYWTEGGFDGPKVRITDTRITTVNPAYYGLVPKAVPQEVTIPGNNPLAPNLSTLSFDKFSGIGQLHAYSVEGRIFIEYLGNVRLAGNIHEFIGSDIVEIVRVPEANYNTVHLGKEITPHEPSVTLAPPPGSGPAAVATTTVTNGKVTGISIINGGSGYAVLTPAPVLSSLQNGVSY